MQVFDLIILVFFTESKAALTEEMYSLIDAVVKQQQTTEGSVASSMQTKESPNSEQQSRKRKLQFKASEIEAVKEQSEGQEKEKCPKTKRKATGEKENAPANVAEKKTPKTKSSRKEKEIAKAQAAENAALRFFNANRPGDASALEKQSKSSPSLGQLPPRASPLQPASTTTLVGPSDVSTTPTLPFTPPSTFSTLSPLPLTSGNFKYISSPACTATQPSRQSSSMLNLLNSPLDDSPDIIELSYASPMASGVGNSSPSSVGSLFKDSLDVLQQSEAEIWDEAPQEEFQCSNCNILGDKIRELEQKLEILSE